MCHKILARKVYGGYYFETPALLAAEAKKGSKKFGLWWTGRDLNPRLPRCERGDHTELIYRPKKRGF
jgi:hypothetical protein